MNACKVLELSINKDLNKLMETAREEIKQTETHKRKGNIELKRYKAAIKYIKSISKICFKEKFFKAWIQGEYQCFTNGRTGFLLTNHIEGTRYVKCV